MRKHKHKRKGFLRFNNHASLSGQSILEVIIALAIFSLTAAVLATMMVGGFNALILGGTETQACALAQEGQEAVRAIRDRDWENLIFSQSGILVSGNQWVFSGEGTYDTIGQYVRTIRFEDVYRDGGSDIVSSSTPGAILDPDSKEVRVEVLWSPREGITNFVKQNFLLTNWQKARGLVVDISSAHLAGKSREVAGITIENIGSSAITIDKMTVFWSGVSSRIKIVEISIDSILVWSGEQASGDLLDISDFILQPGVGAYPIDFLKFSKNSKGILMSITFEMSDGSTESTPFFSP